MRIFLIKKKLQNQVALTQKEFFISQRFTAAKILVLTNKLLYDIAKVTEAIGNFLTHTHK